MGIRDKIAAERRDLADLLDTLTEAQWDAPSLCEGWRVREVAAHLTMAMRHPARRLARELLRARGSMDRVTDRLARADTAALGTRELAEALRADAEHPWKMPIGGYDMVLAHDVVHGLDITVALGLDRRIPEDRLRTALARVGPRSARFFGADLSGVALRADDLDWSFGSGEPVTGPAQELLLLAFGRTVPPGRLRGGAAGRFVRV
ncbi:maleylpyruvate isomerase family mycothiol-dependent enzyme [Streptomyces sp.]|uniref:maleylpyruvate isomerase family mycothiol-dependent enzyme n=1 Tax=Streptomyces sp. TaxID=1931 RepID=UPI002810CC68|nr:maleylpyruvate isomerase family mycothiol-dependent enzyme [Streptomyces sp.]